MSTPVDESTIRSTAQKLVAPSTRLGRNDLQGTESGLLRSAPTGLEDRLVDAAPGALSTAGRGSRLREREGLGAALWMPLTRSACTSWTAA